MPEPTDADVFVEEYHRQIGRKLALMALLVVGIIILAGLFAVSSYSSISISQAYQIIIDHLSGVTYEQRSQSWWADYYIWNTAMPRVCIGMVAGASLAVAGAIMQSLMNNPLADPYSTGISSGACLGAVSSIIMGISYSTVAGEMGIVTNAFIGSMVPAVIIILVSKRVGPSPATLILLGTAISYFFNAMVTYIMISTDADTLQDAYLWQVGSLSGLGWSDLPLMAVVTVVCAIISLTFARQLNVLSIGDKGAKSLGVDVDTFRVICLILVAVMTAAIISYTGIIGFVGLVAPHMVRLVIGSDNRFVIPMSMLAGAFLLVLADYLAMTVSGVSDIPVGVIMSMIGSPVFLVLIIWQRKSYGGVYRWIPTSARSTCACAGGTCCS
ncbi:MAG: iron ABC transporter permease [Thermoplasmata archaeon]|nr:iron ABC transporter permease [Thermoplasmata archaeon]